MKRPFDGTEPCTTVDAEAFFPHPQEREKIAQACAVCRRCPTQKACLAYALEEQMYGVWGGLFLPGIVRRTEPYRQYGQDGAA